MNIQKKSAESESTRFRKGVDDEAILRVAKEVIVKFIEIGRLSPQNFGESFKDVYRSVKEAVLCDKEEG